MPCGRGSSRSSGACFRTGATSRSQPSATCSWRCNAFVGDVVTFYLDAQARESRLVTATQRKNVIALARMLGYRLHGARAATAEVVFNLARVPTADVVIPVGTVVRTQEVTEPVRFQLLADVLIPAGADPPMAVGVVENSQTHSQLFDARGLPNGLYFYALQTPTGTQTQKMLLLN